MRRLAWLPLAVLVLASCRGAPHTPAQTQQPPRDASALPPALAHLNAQLRAGAVVESVAGLELSDPFRALETESAATSAWISAQNEHTERALSPFHEPAAERRLRELLSIGTISDVALGGSRLFFTLREGQRQRPALYVMDLDARPAARTLPQAPLLDPQRYGEHSALDYFYPSADGRYVAFGISDKGDERATLRVLEVDGGKVRKDTIAHAKWSSLGWLADGSGFYYTRYPRPGEEGYDAAAQDTYFPRVFFHRLGQSPEHDPLVFSGHEPTDFPSASASADDRYLTLTNHRSWTASDLWLWDRGEDRKARADAPRKEALRAVVSGEDRTTTGTVHAGMLYLVTKLDAPRGRIVRVAPEHAQQRARWQIVVPEANATLEGWELTREQLVLHYVEEVESKLVLFSLAGERIGEVPLPAAGSVSSLAGTPQGERIAFVWSSFCEPPALFTYDLRHKTLERIYQVQSELDPSACELHKTRVPSQDGTLVNVYYLSRRDLPRDGNAPVLVRGYGGFDVSLLPQFTRSALYFVERGGIYAEANLRGGGEYGDAWHRAGMRENKARVFEDFEAVVRWFGNNGLSRPSRIAITGGSNGGLLMGALVTRAPDAFAAAASYVGLYDMLRYPLFPPAALWTSEYGDPQDPAMARHLLAYSPYHNARKGVAYPAVLVETADHDTRVFWGHSAKFAARLQEANAGPRPVYFYMEREVGHGRGTALDALVRREARKHAFLRQALGLEAHPSP